MCCKNCNIYIEINDEPRSIYPTDHISNCFKLLEYLININKININETLDSFNCLIFINFNWIIIVYMLNLTIYKFVL